MDINQNKASRENRIKLLYRKYVARTSSDAELEEMFALLREKKELKSVREELRTNWDNEGRMEELASLDWETFRSRVRESDRVKREPTSKTKSLVVRLSVAAGLLLILGIASWTWMHREMITIYETGYGEVEEIVLNDNSVVRLNANSKLYWDSNWNRRGSRNVRIEGEAFFNVAHQDGDPFFVATPDLTVMVTGTAFNVTSRRNETRVYLESGEVILKLKQNELKSQTEKISNDEEVVKTLKMVPGEQLSYSSITEKLEQKDKLTIEQAASWKTGELIFKNIPLHEVLQELSYVYGKSFVVEDSTLFERKIDVGMPYSDWETVKGLMQFMIDAKLTENKNKVTIK